MILTKKSALYQIAGNHGSRRQYEREQSHRLIGVRQKTLYIFTVIDTLGAVSRLSTSHVQQAATQLDSRFRTGHHAGVVA